MALQSFEFSKYVKNNFWCQNFEFSKINLKKNLNFNKNVKIDSFLIILNFLINFKNNLEFLKIIQNF